MNEMRTDIDLLIDCIKCQLDSPSSLKQALVTIASSCNKSGGAQSYLKDCGGLHFVHSLLASVSNAEVQNALLYCLGSAVMGNATNQQSLCERGLFARLHKILSQTSAGHKTMQATTFLLLALIANNSNGQLLVRKSGCLTILLNLFRSLFPKQPVVDSEDSEQWFEDLATPTVDLWRSVTSTISVCVNNPQNDENQRVCVSVLPHALRFLQEQPYPCIIKPITSFLGLMVANNVHNQDRVCKCRGLETLVDCLHRTVNRAASDPECLTSAITTISCLDAIINDHSENVNEFGRLGGIGLLLRLLQTGQLDAASTLQVALTLGHTTEAAAENQQRLVEGSGMPILIHQLSNTDNDELSKALKYVLYTAISSTDASQKDKAAMSRIENSEMSKKEQQPLTNKLPRKKTCTTELQQKQRVDPILEKLAELERKLETSPFMNTNCQSEVKIATPELTPVKQPSPPAATVLHTDEVRDLKRKLERERGLRERLERDARQARAALDQHRREEAAASLRAQKVADELEKQCEQQTWDDNYSLKLQAQKLQKEKQELLLLKSKKEKELIHLEQDLLALDNSEPVHEEPESPQKKAEPVDGTVMAVGIGKVIDKVTPLDVGEVSSGKDSGYDDVTKVTIGVQTPSYLGQGLDNMVKHHHPQQIGEKNEGRMHDVGCGGDVDLMDRNFSLYPRSTSFTDTSMFSDDGMFRKPCVPLKRKQKVYEEGDGSSTCRRKFLGVKSFSTPQTGSHRKLYNSTPDAFHNSTSSDSSFKRYSVVASPRISGRITSRVVPASPSPSIQSEFDLSLIENANTKPTSSQVVRQCELDSLDRVNNWRNCSGRHSSESSLPRSTPRLSVKLVRINTSISTPLTSTPKKRRPCQLAQRVQPTLRQFNDPCRSDDYIDHLHSVQATHRRPGQVVQTSACSDSVARIDDSIVMEAFSKTNVHMNNHDCPGCQPPASQDNHMLNSRTYNVAIETSCHTCGLHRTVRQLERVMISATRRQQRKLLNAVKQRPLEALNDPPPTPNSLRQPCTPGIYDFKSSSDSDQLTPPSSPDSSNRSALRNVKKRRQRRRRVSYTEEEERAILEGVAKFGRYWQQILHNYNFHPSRSAVDLKDKYKRIMSHRHTVCHDPSHSSISSRNPRTLSMAEDRRLRRGVQIYGTNWTTILNKYRFSIGRTAGELKDKWRNLNKAHAQVISTCE